MRDWCLGNAALLSTVLRPEGHPLWAEDHMGMGGIGGAGINPGWPGPHNQCDSLEQAKQAAQLECLRM